MIAIDIGTRNLHLVSGQVKGNRIIIDRMLTETMTPGLVQDGIIREFGVLETTIRNMLDKYKVKDKKCVITINGGHIYSRELEVPKASPKVLNNVITFEVKNGMNVNNDVSVEYVTTRHQDPQKPNMLRVRASAMQTDHILDYAKLLKSVKLKPVAMDINPNAIVKLVNGRVINDLQTNGRNLMLFDIGAVTSTAYVISNQEIAYTRIIPVGTMELERYCIKYNENKVPEEHLQLENLDLSLAKLRENAAVGDIVRPLVIALTDGFNRIQQFIAGRIQGNPIDMVYIYGRGATFAGFPETLKESFRTDVQLIEKLSDLNLPEKSVPAPYLNAIGALIRLKG